MNYKYISRIDVIICYTFSIFYGYNPSKLFRI